MIFLCLVRMHPHIGWNHQMALYSLHRPTRFFYSCVCLLCIVCRCMEDRTDEWQSICRIGKSLKCMGRLHKTYASDLCVKQDFTNLIRHIAANVCVGFTRMKLMQEIDLLPKRRGRRRDVLGRLPQGMWQYQYTWSGVSYEYLTART